MRLKHDEARECKRNRDARGLTYIIRYYGYTLWLQVVIVDGVFVTYTCPGMFLLPIHTPAGMTATKYKHCTQYIECEWEEAFKRMLLMIWKHLRFLYSDFCVSVCFKFSSLNTPMGHWWISPYRARHKKLNRKQTSIHIGYYLQQGDYVVCSIGLFVCLFVCMLATLLKKLLTNCDEISWRGPGW